MEIDSQAAKELLLRESQRHPEDLTWVQHSLLVGETAAKIAESLNQRSVEVVGELLGEKRNAEFKTEIEAKVKSLCKDLNDRKDFDDPEAEEIFGEFCRLAEEPVKVDHVKALGFLHDIGKIFRPYSEHLANGFNFLKERGLAPEYCNMTLTHSFLSHNPDIMLSPFRGNQNLMIRDFIQKHDFTMAERIINLCDIICGCETWTLEKRLIDIMTRHGSYEGSQDYIKLAQARKAEFDLMLGKSLYELFPEVRDNL